MSMVGRKGTIITVFSTAYAVGKTLIAINMAAELAKSRHTVCLIDLDLQFGDVASALKLTPEKTIADAERSMREYPDDTVAAEYLTPFSSGGVSFDVLGLGGLQGVDYDPFGQQLGQDLRLGPTGTIDQIQRHA